MARQKEEEDRERMIKENLARGIGNYETDGGRMVFQPMPLYQQY